MQLKSQQIYRKIGNLDYKQLARISLKSSLHGQCSILCRHQTEQTQKAKSAKQIILCFPQDKSFNTLHKQTRCVWLQPEKQPGKKKKSFFVRRQASICAKRKQQWQTVANEEFTKVTVTSYETQKEFGREKKILWRQRNISGADLFMRKKRPALKHLHFGVPILCQNWRFSWDAFSKTERWILVGQLSSIKQLWNWLYAGRLWAFESCTKSRVE